MQVCPICGTEYDDLRCTCCGFDKSQDFERYPTLQPVPKGMTSIAGRKAEYEAEMESPCEEGAGALKEQSSNGWKWIIFVAGLILVVGFVGLWGFLTDNKEISAISFHRMPDRTWAYVGSKVDAAGLQILVHYDDGTTEVVDSGYTVSPWVFKDTGMQDVSVTYEGKMLTYRVLVDERTAGYISLLSRPIQTNYTVGSELDTTGLELFVSYTDGTAEVIDSGYTVSPRRLSTPGATLITVTCGGKTASFFVIVEE